MGILNATTESFYEASQMHTADAVAERALTMLREGASIIDVGGCSTKPGLAPVSEEEEMRRLGMALAAIRTVAPEAIVSVDTFRASIAERCVKEFGVQMINDVSGGEADERMFATVANLQVPYVLTCNKGSWTELMYDLAERINRLHLMGSLSVTKSRSSMTKWTMQKLTSLRSLVVFLSVLPLSRSSLSARSRRLDHSIRRH